MRPVGTRRKELIVSREKRSSKKNREAARVSHDATFRLTCWSVRVGITFSVKKLHIRVYAVRKRFRYGMLHSLQEARLQKQLAFHDKFLSFWIHGKLLQNRDKL